MTTAGLAFNPARWASRIGRRLAMPGVTIAPAACVGTHGEYFCFDLGETQALDPSVVPPEVFDRCIAHLRLSLENEAARVGGPIVATVTDVELLESESFDRRYVLRGLLRMMPA